MCGPGRNPVGKVVLALHVRFHAPLFASVRAHPPLRFRAILLAFVLGALLVPPTAAAHIASDKTQFPDIAATPQADDIMLLVALSVIPQTPVFEPDAEFTRKDLAAWAALAHDHALGGEAPDIAALVQEGARYVATLDGNATGDDINAALFDGRLELRDGAATFTRATAAAFIAAHVDARTLSGWGARPGPTGRVTRVTASLASDGHTTYSMTIGNRTYAVYAHARVVGPTDLTLWTDAFVTRSLLGNEGHGATIIFAQRGPAPSESAGSEDGTSEVPGRSASASTAPPGASDASWAWLLGLVAFLAILAAVLFLRRRV